MLLSLRAGLLGTNAWCGGEMKERKVATGGKVKSFFRGPNPDSPWERHIVKYKRDPTDDHSHSPWELHCPDDNWEHPHIDYEIRKKLLSYFSKVEQSSRRNQDYYGIQKLQQVSQRFPVPLSPEIIQSRLEHNYYRNFEAVKHDIQVMISNALAYFSKNADACMKINRLADFFRRKLQLLV